jgi:tetratricopeptide (TPR) repeat protein
MTAPLYVFVSSKMQELAAERQALRELIPALSNDVVTLQAWVFEEDAPAADRSIRQVYLDALKRSALYIGLFWNELGEWTLDEFERATEWGIDRHIYVKNVAAERRDPRLQAFLDAQSNVISGITPKWFTTVEDLCQQVRKSIEVWLRDRLLRRPGDTAATLAEVSDDLPDLPPRLVGRDALLAELRSLLEGGARVLLQGFGGMGKSALAAAATAAWLDEDRGKVLWLRAGSEDADTMLEALARPLDNAQAVTTVTGAEKAKALRRLLTDAQISLIVLDDVWDGTALSQVLKAVPRQVPVLVTARQRYALDHIIEVGKLEAGDALHLLSQHAGQPCDDDAARELCRQVGYHPFALEIAGKTLKVDRIRPADLLRRIAAAPHALAMPEDFAEEGRTSISELLTASLYALDEPTREVFLAFGALFAPQATSALLARYMGRDEDSVREALITLGRRGLADRLPESAADFACYRVHDLAHSYARAVLTGRGADPLAVIEACRAYAVEHEGDLTALDAEINNLLGAADAARQHHQPDALIAIMQALSGPYLTARGHTLHFLELLDAAIEAAARLGPDHDEVRHYLLGKRGNAFYDRGDLPQALHHYQQALDLARALGRQDRQALLLCAVGKVLADQRDDRAAAHFQAAYEIAKALDDSFLLGFVLEHQGYHAQSQGDFGAARDYFAEEVTLAQRINDPETLFYALLNLGSTEHDLGQCEAALEHHQQALQIARDLDNRIWTAYALQSMGEDYHRLGHDAQAQQCFSQALTLFRECGLKTKADEVEATMSQAGYPIE